MNLQEWGKPPKASPMPEEGIREELILMETDPKLDTRVSLVKGAGESMQLISFQEKHLSYLRGHPKVNSHAYLTNLKTMIKIRLEK
jgi:hypothetical protein